MSLSLTDISFAYDSAPVLKGVSLCAHEGEFIGLIGANGSGKSTLIKLIAGLLSPQTGNVSIDGMAINPHKRTEIAKKIAYVPQETHVAFPLHVRELVSLGRLPHQSGMFGETASDRLAVKTALQATNCDQFATRYMHHLSGGERQRVFIARALAQSPRLLLCDEPTTHLDLKHQVECMQLLARLSKDNGLTIVASLHDINLVARYCTRVWLLENGRISACGNPLEVLTTDNLGKAFDTTIEIHSDPDTGRFHYEPTK